MEDKTTGLNVSVCRSARQIKLSFDGCGESEVYIMATTAFIWHITTRWWCFVVAVKALARRVLNIFNKKK